MKLLKNYMHSVGAVRACSILSLVIILLITSWLYLPNQDYSKKSNVLEIKIIAEPRDSDMSHRMKQTKQDGNKIHIVFSTGCSFYQDWQSQLVFHSALSVKQKGKITRIATGCDGKKQKELMTLYTKLYPQYSVHFTPDFKNDKYNPNNKPFGVKHWLQHSNPLISNGTVVVIIDPDMIFLRPITSKVRGKPDNVFLNNFNPGIDHVPIKVQQGEPVAQLYGIGAQWTDDRNHYFNRSFICGADSPCLDVQHDFAMDHYRFHLLFMSLY